VKKRARILFINEAAKFSFESLKKGNGFERRLHESIGKALEKISRDAFCGIQIPKKLFLREYVLKHDIGNLWKYNIPSGWRLIYTITSDGEAEIIAVILDWFSHKEYERKFRY